MSVAETLSPGQTVIYRPRHVREDCWDPTTQLYHGEERGVVSSVGDEWVYVRFGAGCTAAACRPSDLIADWGQDRAPALLAEYLGRGELA